MDRSHKNNLAGSKPPPFPCAPPPNPLTHYPTQLAIAEAARQTLLDSNYPNLDDCFIRFKRPNPDHPKLPRYIASSTFESLPDGAEVFFSVVRKAVKSEVKDEPVRPPVTKLPTPPAEAVPIIGTESTTPPLNPARLTTPLLLHTPIVVDDDSTIVPNTPDNTDPEESESEGGVGRFERPTTWEKKSSGQGMQLDDEDEDEDEEELPATLPPFSFDRRRSPTVRPSGTSIDPTSQLSQLNLDEQLSSTSSTSNTFDNSFFSLPTGSTSTTLPPSSLPFETRSPSPPLPRSSRERDSAPSPRDSADIHRVDPKIVAAYKAQKKEDLKNLAAGEEEDEDKMDLEAEESDESLCVGLDTDGNFALMRGNEKKGKGKEKEKGRTPPAEEEVEGEVQQMKEEVMEEEGSEESEIVVTAKKSVKKNPFSSSPSRTIPRTPPSALPKRSQAALKHHSSASSPFRPPHPPPPPTTTVPFSTSKSPQLFEGVDIVKKRGRVSSIGASPVPKRTKSDNAVASTSKLPSQPSQPSQPPQQPPQQPQQPQQSVRANSDRPKRYRTSLPPSENAPPSPSSWLPSFSQTQPIPSPQPSQSQKSKKRRQSWD